jgi:hypothetical protein
VLHNVFTLTQPWNNTTNSNMNHGGWCWPHTDSGTCLRLPLRDPNVMDTSAVACKDTLPATALQRCADPNQHTQPPQQHQLSLVQIAGRSVNAPWRSNWQRTRCSSRQDSTTTATAPMATKTTHTAPEVPATTSACTIQVETLSKSRLAQHATTATALAPALAVEMRPCHGLPLQP